MRTGKTLHMNLNPVVAYFESVKGKDPEKSANELLSSINRVADQLSKQDLQLAIHFLKVAHLCIMNTEIT